MRPDELRDSGSLAGTALSEVATLAGDVHRAVSQRVFGALGPAAAPVRRAHDGIAAVAYGSTRLGVALLPPLVGGIAAAFAGPDATSAHDTRTGKFAFAALSGFWGDRIAERNVSLAPPMRLRTHDGVHGRGSAADVADPTGRLVVFVHGVCETDASWWLGAEKQWGDRDTTYGSLLAADDGWTPRYLAYNSGLHISANGRALAELLDKTVQTWPVPVTEIALVGHSMGGLVVRSAAHQADTEQYGWATSLRHVFCLGTPHLGAPLERLANAGSHALRLLPETRPFATWLDRRSVGIKDLRYGSLVEADWRDVDVDEFLRDRCTEVPLLPQARYYFVGVTLTRDPHSRLASIVGDLLVQYASASGEGRTRRIGFDVEHGLHIGGLNHFDLLDNPRVYTQLRDWLRTDA